MNKTAVSNFKTYNDIVRECTRQYISGKQSAGTIPAPKDMANELLEKIQNEVELENVVLGDKTRRYKMPKHLENASIAELILAFYPVKRISWTESDRESNNLLCIYQTGGENRGIYAANRNAFANLIREFHYCISEKDIGEIMSILKDKSPLCSVTDNPDLIAVNNGIFDYRSKQLMDFSPDYVFTVKSKVNYNPQAGNVTIHNPDDGTDWDVETWFDSLSDDPDIVKLLWQITGAVVRPNVPWDKVACFYSEVGNNGKGTLCELLRQLCGNFAAISFEQFAQPFLLEQLIEAGAVIADENNTSAYLKSAEALKCIITGDCFTINGKYKKPVAFRFRGLMVQCVNSLPKFSDRSDSLARRILMVPFEKCFTGQERKYIKADYLKRPEVLEYVLKKVLNTSFYSFDEPAACKGLLNEFRQFNDPVREFLDEMLPELVWDLVPIGFLYDLYKAWFAKNNPNGLVLRKRQFIKDVNRLMRNDSGWQIISDSPQPPKNRMDKPEPLIVEYNLTAWKNPVYHGNDPDRICLPPLKGSYRGILRVQGAVTGKQPD